ncbi:hypothetical protein BS78_06G242800 [Paspalum vaginatum]|nr:hypothetical protein BS78_06G242800 [Paspalum vaginatum]
MRTSSRNAQDRESKAFEMSSLSSILGIFFFRNNAAAHWTNLKLSKINSPLIIINNDVMAAFGAFFLTNGGSFSLNSGLIVLLPKRQGALVTGRLQADCHGPQFRQARVQAAGPLSIININMVVSRSS